MQAWSLLLTSNYDEIPRGPHIAYFVGYEVVVIAQEMRSGLSEDSDEVDVVRISHYGPVLLRCRPPWHAQSRRCTDVIVHDVHPPVTLLQYLEVKREASSTRVG